MHCPRCGWDNPEGATNCANCQADLSVPAQPEIQGSAPRPHAAGPPDYLGWSIAITVLSALMGSRCCISLVATAFGILAIVKSSQANTRKAIGDFAGAMQDAITARTWIYWSAGVWIGSIVLTVIAVVLYFIVYFIVMSSMLTHSHGF
jgi:hypothetical protein